MRGESVGELEFSISDSALRNWSLPDCDATLDEESSDLIDHTCAQADKTRAHTMQCQPGPSVPAF
jgi:hypothetical protein